MPKKRRTNCPKVVKNENVQKTCFFCSFYVTLSLHAKHRIVGLMEWPVANTKIKRGKKPIKLNGPKNFNFLLFLSQKLGFKGRKCGQGDIVLNCTSPAVSETEF